MKLATAQILVGYAVVIFSLGPWGVVAAGCHMGCLMLCVWGKR